MERYPTTVTSARVWPRMDHFIPPERHVYRSLHRVRPLTVGEISMTVEYSMRGRVSVWLEGDMHLAPLLKKGQGFLLIHWGRGLRQLHVSSLFRARNGQLFLYDSSAVNAVPFLRDYLTKYKQSLLLNPFRLQHCGVRTCSYHGLAFMDYATRSPLMDPVEVFESFARQIEGNSDEFVVKAAQRILPHSVDIRKNKYYKSVLNNVVCFDDTPERNVRYLHLRYSSLSFLHLRSSSFMDMKILFNEMLKSFGKVLNVMS